MKLILKSFLICLLFFSFYQLFITHFKADKKNQSYQSWWQENLVKAQQFVYQERTDSILLVGSSMSANLDLSQGKPYIYNLSFIGGSSLTGLAILKQSKKKPKLILIEMNWIDRAIDGSMVDQLFSPTFGFVKKNLSVLQEINQPVNVIGFSLQNAFHIDKINTELHLDSATFLKTLKNNVKSDDRVDSVSLSNFLNQTKAFTSYFKSKGINVLYLMIPANPEIEGSRKYKIIRDFLQKQEEGIIPSPHFKQLKTTDGYHFDKPSAAIYSNYLKKYLANEVH